MCNCRHGGFLFFTVAACCLKWLLKTMHNFAQFNVRVRGFMLFRSWPFNFFLNLSCFLHWLFYTICYTFSGTVTMKKKVKTCLDLTNRYDFALVCAVILDALKSEFEICGTSIPRILDFYFGYQMLNNWYLSRIPWQTVRYYTHMH